jgi:hypothetical protein
LPRSGRGSVAAAGVADAQVVAAAALRLAEVALRLGDEFEEVRSWPAFRSGRV